MRVILKQIVSKVLMWRKNFQVTERKERGHREVGVVVVQKIQEEGAGVGVLSVTVTEKVPASKSKTGPAPKNRSSQIITLTGLSLSTIHHKRKKKCAKECRFETMSTVVRDAKHTSPEEAEHRLNVVVNMRKKAGRPVGSSTKKKKRSSDWEVVLGAEDMEEFVDEQAEEVDSDMEDDDMPALTEDSDDNDDSDSDEDVLIFQKGPNDHEAQSKATGFGEVQESADVQIDAEEKSVQEGEGVAEEKTARPPRPQGYGVYDYNRTRHGTVDTTEKGSFASYGFEFSDFKESVEPLENKQFKTEASLFLHFIEHENNIPIWVEAPNWNARRFFKKGKCSVFLRTMLTIQI